MVATTCNCKSRCLDIPMEGAKNSSFQWADAESYNTMPHSWPHCFTTYGTTRMLGFLVDTKFTSLGVLNQQTWRARQALPLRWRFIMANSGARCIWCAMGQSACTRWTTAERFAARFSAGSHWWWVWTHINVGGLHLHLNSPCVFWNTKPLRITVRTMLRWSLSCHDIYVARYGYSWSPSMSWLVG